MSAFRKIGRLIGNYFAFVGGFLFIFTLGVIYAFIKPQGLLINGIFIVLGFGWMGFLVKYFWELMEKNNRREKPVEEITDINITKSSETAPPDTNKPTGNV